MTPAEAADLLARCAAFDNRKPSLVAAQAWANALQDLPLDEDCFTAVDRFYGTPPREPGQRLWIQPHDVRTHRRQIRAERTAHFVYEPPADDRDGDPAYLTRYRAQLAALASGKVLGPSSGPALEGGPHPSVVPALEGALHLLDDSNGTANGEPVAKVRRPGPLGVDCPQCHAAVGRPCKTGLLGDDSRRVKELRRPHAARVRVASGGPARLESPEEIERRREASLQALAQLEEAS
ncbi:hypothetical protein [Streptomyces sp. NPDC006997]|uniref:zinc finger domain-containing protein n=1 Tax=Streptomyces sp. NPDC006997 TaxID=3155356 RepID=UPI0033FB2230